MTTPGATRWWIGAVVVVALLLPEVVASTSPAAAVAGFGDVSESRFFAEPVAWMVATDLTTGTASGCFSPDDTTTRAETATFLHRHAGTPAPALPSSGGSNGFRD